MITYDRRKFLRRSIAAVLGGATLGSALGQMKLVEAAVNAKGGFADYRALVCIFLFGGNDGFNTIVPMDGTARAHYQVGRATLALPVSAIRPLAPFAGGDASDGCTYGMYDALAGGEAIGTTGLHALFGQGRLAVMSNVGTLVRPTTKAQYGTVGFPLPPQLYSHNDQQTYWQTSGNAAGLGYVGRMADLLHAGNANTSIPMSFTTAGESRLLRGGTSDQYAINAAPRGAEAIFAVEGAEHAQRRAALQQLAAADAQSNVLERSYATRMRKTLANYTSLAGALATANVQPFPNTFLGRQLDMVARLISVRQALGMGRQVFFVQMPGYDMHDNQTGDHPALLSELAQAMRAFYDATVAMGIANAVTTFTASDFGRTLSSNGDGSDHGWGSHHLVMGGAINGGRFYGALPNLTSDGPDDVGGGQVIPTTSVEQYAATMGAWLGVDSGTLADIFPNLANFSVQNLGFI